MSRHSFDNQYMKAALEEAQKAALCEEVPVGAVIVYEHKIIGRAHNMSGQLQDPRAHAELLAIDQALQHFKTLKDTRQALSQCKIYVTLQPCPMCEHAISLMRIGEIYFSAYRDKATTLGEGGFQSEVYGGIMEQAGRELLQNFFLNLRKHV